MIIQVSKVKEIEDLKTAREKQLFFIKKLTCTLKVSADISEETLHARRKWHDTFKVLKMIIRKR